MGVNPADLEKILFAFHRRGGGRETDFSFDENRDENRGSVGWIMRANFSRIYRLFAAKYLPFIRGVAAFIAATASHRGLYFIFISRRDDNNSETDIIETTNNATNKFKIHPSFFEIRIQFSTKYRKYPFSKNFHGSTILPMDNGILITTLERKADN